MDGLELRVHDIEIDLKGIHDRLGSIEDSTKSAWHKINETNIEVDNLYEEIDGLKKEVNEMKTDVKGMKAEMETQSKYLKWLAIGVLVLAGVILVTGLVAMSKGSDVPEKVVELMVPAIQKVLS